MSYFDEQYNEYKEMSTESLKRELKDEEYFLRVESVDTDITALHNCGYCRLRISAIEKVLTERSVINAT